MRSMPNPEDQPVRNHTDPQDGNITSPELAQTEPLADDSTLPDANLGIGDQCTLKDVGEQARPDTGDACDDDRAG